jgi:hypothetical protein
LFPEQKVFFAEMGRDNKKGRGGGRGSGRRIEVANEEELALRELQIEQHKESRAKRRAEEDDGGDVIVYKMKIIVIFQ